jgi:hypothetical protein
MKRRLDISKGCLGTLLPVLGFVCAKISRRSSNVFLKLAELSRRKLREGRHPSRNKTAVPDHRGECTVAQRNGGSAEVGGVDTCYNLPSMTPRAVHLINRPSQFGRVLI